MALVLQATHPPLISRRLSRLPAEVQCPLNSQVTKTAITRAKLVPLGVTLADTAQAATKPQTAATAIPVPIVIQSSNARFAAPSSRHGIEEPDRI